MIGGFRIFKLNCRLLDVYENFRNGQSYALQNFVWQIRACELELHR